MPTHGNAPNVISVPADAVVTLIGPPASGKTTLRGNLPQVVSLDASRETVTGDASNHDQDLWPAVKSHFDTTRLKLISNGGLGYINDSTNLTTDARAQDLFLARRYRRPAIAVLAQMRGHDLLAIRNLDLRRGRVVPDDKLKQMLDRHRGVTVEKLLEEGYDEVHIFGDNTRLVVGPDARNLTGPRAVLADPHGTALTTLPVIDELRAQGLQVITVGDLGDKGGVRAAGPYGTGNPADSGAVNMYRYMLANRDVLNVLGNHCWNLLRFLRHLARHRDEAGGTWQGGLHALLQPDSGAPQTGFGLQQTLLDFVVQPDADQLIPQVISYLDRLPTHLVFDDLVVAHGGMKNGRLFGGVRATKDAMYMRGDFPWYEPAVRSDGTPGRKLVHGHAIQKGGPRRRVTPHPGGLHCAEVISIDTGAYQGGGLTAYFTATDTLHTYPTHPADICPAAELAEMKAKLRELFGDAAA